MGIVMLWDQGSWEPLVDDVDAALKKGDLKLRLNGVKLKGSWALIRTGGDGRSWLLLKHRDEWAGPLDIATFAPLQRQERRRPHRHRRRRGAGGVEEQPRRERAEPPA